MTQSKKLAVLIRSAVKSHTPEELALGWLRYETLRTLNVRRFSELSEKNLKQGIAFDDLVTDLIVTKYEGIK
jgi:hypothetical protein